ncbi:MAG: MFS transporter, partial [Caulobacterales bacterium]
MIWALAKWRPEIPKSDLPHESLHHAIGAGLRYVSLSPAINSVLIRSVLFGFGAAGIWALMPLIAHDLLKGGPMIYGIVFGAFGAGAMGGALITARLRARFRSDVIVNYSVAAFATGAIIAGFSHWIMLTAIGTFMAGVAWVLALSTFNVAVQMSSPRWVAGRSISIYQMAVFSGLAIGSAFWGFVGNTVGLPGALCLSGLFLLSSLGAALKFKMPSLEGAALDPWTRRQMSDPVLELTPRSGPIAVTIEYIVDADNAHDFVVAMQEMGRIRQRDGARRWTLTQDIDNPELWTEQYRSPTWLDHLHRQTRPTVADESARAHALSFHKGETAPVVHRMIERPSADVFRESTMARADAFDGHGPQH